MNIYDNLPAAVLKFLFNNKTLYGGGALMANIIICHSLYHVWRFANKMVVCVTAVSLIAGKANVTEKRKARLS